MSQPCSQCGTLERTKRCSCRGAHYCGTTCQRAHYGTHKPVHQDLLDRRLLGLPAVTDDELEGQLNEPCPICMHPMPSNHSRSSFRTCCGKHICGKCDESTIMSAPVDRCPFCREPGATTGEASVARLRKLVERNPENATAISVLGDHYKKGDGVTADPAEAHRLYTQAATLGNGGASCALGEIYSQGHGGVEVDPTESRRWFELGITQGSIVARHNLGVSLTMRGEHTEAKAHFFGAVARGYEGSVRSLRIMQSAQQGVSEAEIGAARRLCQRAQDI